MAPLGRGLLGATVATVTALVAAPSEWPAAPDALDRARTVTELTVFALRVLAAGLSAYIALVFLAVVLASLPIAPRTVRRLVARWTGAGLASSIRRLAGASVLSIGVLSVTPITAAGASPAPVLTPVAEPPAPTIAPAAAAVASDPGPTLAPELDPPPADPSHRRWRNPGPAPVLAPTTAPEPGPSGPGPGPDPRATGAERGDEPAPTTSQPPTARPDPDDGTVRVEPGDSFWSIAERELARHLGRTATEAEVARWWARLVEVNRDRLVEPGHPDLLFPGQELRLPPPPTGS